MYTGIKILDMGLFLSEVIQLKNKIMGRELILNKRKLTVLEDEVIRESEDESNKTDLDTVKKNMREYHSRYLRGEIKIPHYLEDKLQIAMYDNGLGVVFESRPNIKGTYLDLILEFKSVKEYAYFDNVDKPEGIKDWEWDMRRIAWEKAIGKSDDISTEFEERLVIDVYEERLTLKRVIELIELYKKED